MIDKLLNLFDPSGDRLVLYRYVDPITGEATMLLGVVEEESFFKSGELRAMKIRNVVGGGEAWIHHFNKITSKKYQLVNLLPDKGLVRSGLDVVEYEHSPISQAVTWRDTQTGLENKYRALMTQTNALFNYVYELQEIVGASSGDMGQLERKIKDMAQMVKVTKDTLFVPTKS